MGRGAAGVGGGAGDAPLRGEDAEPVRGPRAENWVGWGKWRILDQGQDAGGEAPPGGGAGTRVPLWGLPPVAAPL